MKAQVDNMNTDKNSDNNNKKITGYLRIAPAFFRAVSR
jgi:hypothetical protein